MLQVSTLKPHPQARINTIQSDTLNCYRYERAVFVTSTSITFTLLRIYQTDTPYLY